MKLRIDPHAQYEIQVYAQVMGDIAKAVVPHAYEAFEDYILNSTKFSSVELQVLGSLLKDIDVTEEYVTQLGLKGREAREFVDKYHLKLKK